MVEVFLEPRRIGNHFRFHHRVAESVVTVPAHGRREGECIAANDLIFCRSLAGRIFSGDSEGELAGFGQRPGDNSRLRVQRKSTRQMFGGKCHRLFPARCNRKNHRSAKPGAKSRCSIEPKSMVIFCRGDDLRLARGEIGVGRRNLGVSRQRGQSQKQAGRDEFHGVPG